MIFKAEIVFVRVLLPFILGISFTYFFSEKELITPILIFTSILFCCLLFNNAFYKKFRAYNYKEIIGLTFYLFCFSFGSLICLLNNQSLRNNYFAYEEYQYLKVWINSEPTRTNDILRFEVNVTEGLINNRYTKTSGKLLIALKIDNLNPIRLHYGEELLITAKYLPVEPGYNPGEFDFKSWLASKNLYQQTFINQNQLVKLNKTRGNPIIQYAIEEREKKVAIYRKLIKNDEAFAVASTLVLGYRANLSKETLSDYSKTGTIHALSVSGSHIAIIFFLLNSILSFLDRNKALKILKVILICALIWFYSLLTGFSPSVLRSAIMITIYILAKAFNKETNNYNILAFTAFCLLVYNPFFIVDVGFQLSFLSVFGLIYLQPKIYKWLYVKNKYLDKLWSAVALSLAAQLVTFPLSIYYFHQFPVYFLVGNLFILLPLIGMMYLGIGILVLRVYFLAPLFEWLINFTNGGLKFISKMPFSGVTSIWLNSWQFLLLSLAFSLLVFSLANFKKKPLILSVCLLILFQTYSAYSKLKVLKQHKILFFSLRKNYATAFIDGDKAILITDLNAKDKNYQFFIAPGLDKLQIKEVRFVKWEKDTASNNFRKSNTQIAFKSFSILLVDSSFNYKRIENKPSFNMIWLHKNPNVKLKNLKDEVKFKTLVIDATNKDYRIEYFKKESNKIHLTHHILKKNNSYLVDLN